MRFYFYDMATQQGILSYVWMEVSHVGLRGVFEYAVMSDSLMRTAMILSEYAVMSDSLMRTAMIL